MEANMAHDQDITKIQIFGELNDNSNFENSQFGDIIKRCNKFIDIGFNEKKFNSLPHKYFYFIKRELYDFE